MMEEVGLYPGWARSGGQLWGRSVEFQSKGSGENGPLGAQQRVAGVAPKGSYSENIVVTGTT